MTAVSPARFSRVSLLAAMAALSPGVRLAPAAETTATITAAAAGAAIWNELGSYPIRHFSTRDHLAIHSASAIVQDARGVMFVGSRNHVLEFDGEQWTVIPAPDFYHIDSLAFDADGRLWVGGSPGIGYIETDATGRPRLVSLLDQLPEPDRALGDVRAIHARPDGIYFGARYAVLRWRDGRFTIWKRPTDERIRLLSLGGELWIAQRGAGLSRFENEDWTLVSEIPLFKEFTVVDALVEPDGAWLVATSRQGLFRFRPGESDAAPLRTDADEVLKSHGIHRLIRLRDGGIGCSLLSGGAVLLTARGECEAVIDQAYGASDERIDGIFEDRDGNVWLGSLTGLRSVQRGPITVFDQRRGYAISYVNGWTRRDGRLFIATGSGLFRYEPHSPAEGGARLALAAGAPAVANGVVSHRSGLLFSRGANLLRLVDDAGAVEICAQFPSTVQRLRQSPSQPDVIFVGMEEGLAIARFDGEKWRNEGSVPGIAEGLWSVQEHGAGTVWAMTAATSPYRVTFPADAPYAPAAAMVERFGTEAGLPSVDSVHCRVVRGEAIFGGNGFGPYVFDAMTKRFVSYDALRSGRDDEPFIEEVYAQETSGAVWARLSGGAANSPLAWRAAARGVRDATGRVQWEFWKPRIFGELFAFPLLLEETPAGVVAWTEDDAGIVRIDLSRATARRDGPPPAFIQSVTAEAQPVRDGDELEFADRALLFRYAAPHFGRERRFFYETRLEGVDRDWREPTIEPTREIGTPAEGRYRFLVRTVDALGRRSEPAALAFRVLPPLHRTSAAYAGYAIVAALGVFGIVRWRVAALHRKNRQLESLIAARTEELRAARDEADRANRAKSAFLANMSHELRTPLNGILGYTQILQRDAAIDARNRQRLAVLETSGEHLLRLINEVLDLSKIEAGRLELHPAPSDLRALAAAVAASFRPRFEEKRLAFELAIDPALPARLLLDEQKVGQVLFNLLGNALKFTPAGSVALRIQRRNDRVRFEVTDTGIGIPAEQQAAIFEPFRQVADPTRRSDGAGLGLTICSRLVALMGGELRVASEVDRGSRFWFEIPLAPVEEATPPASAPSPTASVTGYSGPRKCVLVVDDIAVNRDVVRDMLAPLGFSVEAAAAGAEALALAQERAPDLVLMDLRMAPMSGAEVIQRLRAEPRLRAAKIVAFSASTIGFGAADAVKLGCDDHLPKPFREAELLAVLERQLGVQWMRNGASGLAATADHADHVVAPDPSRARTLLSYAQRGDAAGLRAALHELAAAEPQLASFAAEINQLLAGYRMHEIRERLEKFAAPS